MWRMRGNLPHRSHITAVIWLAAASVIAALMLTACGTAPVATSSSRAITVTGTYTVKAGDTLYAIAKRFGTTVTELATLNRLDAQYRIFPGQVLRLSAASSSAASTATNSSNNSTSSTASNKPLPTTVNAPQFRWPTQGSTAMTTRPNGGEGLMISGQLGQEIRATAEGKVVYSGNGLLGYGQLLIIKHDDQWLSAYGHLQRILVAEGAEVAAGQTIATMGQNTAGAAMLYFELRVNGSPVAPLRLLPSK